MKFYFSRGAMSLQAHDIILNIKHLALMSCQARATTTESLFELFFELLNLDEEKPETVLQSLVWKLPL